MDPSYKIKITASLEDTLVNEFRVFQQLVELSKRELDALTERDTKTLMVLVEKKETLLDELGHLEELRQIATEDIAYLSGLKKTMPTVMDILPFLDKPSIERIKRIQDGIMALGKEIRRLNRSNLVLAKTALEWADATQTYLLSLYQPQYESYQVPGKTPKYQSAVRSFDQRV